MGLNGYFITKYRHSWQRWFRTGKFAKYESRIHYRWSCKDDGFEVGISDDLVHYADEKPDPRNTFFSNVTNFFNSRPDEKARLPAEFIRTLRSEVENRVL
jgi:hypothetical protein